jgi:hypothetical protein
MQNLYRIEQTWRRGPKVLSSRVFWVKAPNARAASLHVQTDADSQSIERFGQCDWGPKVGIVFDSKVGLKY